MAHRSPLEIPGDLRVRLEVARLDLLALFRALDRMDLSAAEIPQRLLRQLFERDADYAEALWALDQVEGRLDRRAMLRDTLTALDHMDFSAQEIPQRLLRQLFERDADYAEALWALDQAEGRLDRRAMLRDTLKALDQLPSASAQFRKQLPARAHPTLEHLESSSARN